MERERPKSENPNQLPQRGLSEDQQSFLRATLFQKAGLIDEDLPVLDALLKAPERVNTTALVNKLVEEKEISREKARRTIYIVRDRINEAFKNEGIEISNTLVDPQKKALGSTWWIENVEALLPKEQVQQEVITELSDTPVKTKLPSATVQEPQQLREESRVNLKKWSEQFPVSTRLTNVDDIFVTHLALRLRDYLKRGVTVNPITAIRQLLATCQQNATVLEPAEEAIVVKEPEPESKSELLEVPPSPLDAIPQQQEEVREAISALPQPVQEAGGEVGEAIPVLPQSPQESEEVETQEEDKFSIQDAAALSLLVGSLDGTSLGVDDNTVFEFRIEKEVIDICNRLVWSLPFEYGDTIKLYASDYLKLRKGALERVRDMLMLDDDEILEIAGRQDHEDIENLLVGLSLGGALQRQRTIWFFNQILDRPEDVSWNDETGYITQLWRNANVSGTIDQSSSMVDVIENTLQTEEYLEIIPSDPTKSSIEIPEEQDVKLGTIEKRDREVRNKIRIYVDQVRSLSKMPSWLNSGQISQYFKPAIRASDVDELQDKNFITPVTYRGTTPYYDINAVLILLYMRNKPEKIDVTGLQRGLKKLVAEELEKADSKS